ncbi:MAG: hypothetical protein ACTHJK_02020 [Sphingomicrobium sp.]
MTDLTGGCMCRAVRYELRSKPFDCGWCARFSDPATGALSTGNVMPNSGKRGPKPKSTSEGEVSCV